MMRITCFIAIVFCTLFVVNDICANPADNYGEFNLRMDKFEKCKGPKRKDCCDINADMFNNTAVNYHLHLDHATKITKGKITANTNHSAFLRLQMKDPCDHLFLQQFLQTALNITKNCVVNPGTYELVVDIAKIAEKYYGGMFLYGTFMFKSLFLAKDCNFSCTNVVVTFLPKK